MREYDVPEEPAKVVVACARRRGGACVSALDYAARADRARAVLRALIGASVWFGGTPPRCLVEQGPPAWRPSQRSP